jgi:biopolymer transport protein ExbD
MADNWQIRFESTGSIVAVETPARVFDGLKSGEWEATDEVRGPSDADWRPIQDHPAFADTVSDLEPPHIDPPDETRLDMNPLIDVALVLLIFFILTTTYASLRRSIEVPPEPDDKSGKQNLVKPEDLKDVAFNVTIWMDGDTPRIKLEDKIIDEKELERALGDHVRNTGRRQLILSVDGKVPWGVEAAVHDAAKSADVTQIYRRKYKPAS